MIRFIRSLFGKGSAEAAEPAAPTPPTDVTFHVPAMN